MNQAAIKNVAELKAQQIKPLAPARLREPDFGWRTWEATVPRGTTPAELMDGRFWALCARRVALGDHIRWRTDSLTEFGELVCVACDSHTGSIELRELWAKTTQQAQKRTIDSQGGPHGSEN